MCGSSDHASPNFGLYRRKPQDIGQKLKFPCAKQWTKRERQREKKTGKENKYLFNFVPNGSMLEWIRENIEHVENMRGENCCAQSVPHFSVDHLHKLPIKTNFHVCFCQFLLYYLFVVNSVLLSAELKSEMAFSKTPFANNFCHLIALAVINSLGHNGHRPPDNDFGFLSFGFLFSLWQNIHTFSP